MFLNQLDSRSKRLRQILETLAQNHQFDMPLRNHHVWNQLLEHYTAVQAQIRASNGFNSYHTNPLYVKACLITEALQMLIEIAPRRRRKRVKESLNPQENSMPSLNEKASKAKPDFLDIDKDGNKKETFKKALKDKARAEKLDEKWGTEMKTAPKDVGKWDGYTIAELKARKKKLMDKEERTAAESKEVRQINFAIRAKQEDGWGKIKKEGVEEAREMIDQEEMDRMMADYKAKGGTIKQGREKKAVGSQPKAWKGSAHDTRLATAQGYTPVTGIRRVSGALREYAETIHSDEAFDNLKKAGAKNVRTTSGEILFHVGKDQHKLPHHDNPDGHRHVRRAEYDKAMAVVKRGKVQESRRLLENEELDHAETLLAAKDISDRLQNMAEDAAKMAVDRLMPLVDTMKSQFGQEAANGFNEVVKANLQSVLDTVIKAKDETDNAILALQGGQTPSAGAQDMSAELPAATPAEAPAGAPAEAPAAAPEGGAGEPSMADIEKEFDAVVSASGPKEEPLGRSLKEPVAEARQRCMECGGMYETLSGGHMVCTECGSMSVAEAKKAVSPYAVGMAKAQELTGDKPPLKKSTIQKAHEIARGIEKGQKKESVLAAHKAIVETLKNQYESLQESFQAHKQQFAQRAGRVDPLGHGYGLEGASILRDIRQVRDELNEAIGKYKQLHAEIQEQKLINKSVDRRIQNIQEQATSKPYGVLGIDTNGNRIKKFFESQEHQQKWINYNQDRMQEYRLIDPSTLAQLKENLKNSKN